MNPPCYFVFDIESVGLHGEGFAVGWILVAADGTELDSARYSCPPEIADGHPDDLAWVNENCAGFTPNLDLPSQVRSMFWAGWMQAKARGAVAVADCSWPVEARFLAACIDKDRRGRQWDGPYPLHDVATARFAAGLDPLATTDRLPNEEPKHDPLADARQSARLFLEALALTRGARDST